MSAELRALLDAIRANPEDDLPRLALADWCLEQPDAATQARGEFIHMRCRAALLPAEDPERAALEARASELRRRHERAWLGGLETLAAGWHFERGMVLLEVTGRSLRKQQLARLAGQRGWQWVIGLRGLLLEAADLNRVVGSPLLAQLTSLDFTDCDLGPAGARALADAPHAAQLTRLALGYCRLGDDGACALAACPTGRLTMLTLCNNAIGPRGCKALAGSAALTRLTLLDLSRNPIGNAGVRALAGSASLAGLTELLLASGGIGDRGVAALVDSPHLGAIRRLDLSDNAIGEPSRRDLRERFAGRVVF